ncbi:MAG: tRNA (N(6)-L-threonylcarbamoyladenosine(37)-C(2))-methylthiotransferase MtaB, partial [Fusobacterium sp.]|nr:tRNA (N(6)-L-threonylcarbamoyladenosine(37)-C(2))-methylthiotransferase MtaB [Fusobacterium sp.]
QSCDDTVLKNMRRKYGSSLIDERLLKLKNEVEDMEFSADVIVGFPKETDEMFQNTSKLIKKINFSNLHIFQYSDREGTIASNMDGKVDTKIKKERANKLEEVKKIMYEDTRKKYIGRTLEILVEEEKNNEFYGYSDNYIRIKFPKTSEEDFTNKIIKLNIVDFNGDLLIGEISENFNKNEN